MNTIQMRITDIFCTKHIPVKNRLQLRKKQPNYAHSKATGIGKTEISGNTICGNITAT